MQFFPKNANFENFFPKKCDFEKFSTSESEKYGEIFLFIFILCMIPSHMQVAQVNIIQKIYFFPSRRKNCEEISPYFSLSEVENFSKLYFFGKKLSIFWGKKFTNLGVKIEKI